MATKPNIAESRWAVDGANADASNVTAPSSGARDTGWTLNQVPSSAVENYLRGRVYRWLQYLSDGALSGNHTIAGTLGVSSALTVTSGGIAVTAGGLLVSAGGATITGAVAITGAASVSSGFVANGGITVPTSQVVNLQGTTTLSVGGAATVGGTLGVTGVLTASGGMAATTLASSHVTGSETVDGAFALTGTISPAALSGASNQDYNPTGLSSATAIRLSTTGAPPIGLGGLAGGSAGRIVTMLNVGSSDIVFSSENTGSIAANRFVLPAGATITVRAGGSIVFWYDATSSRWRVIGGIQ